MSTNGRSLALNNIAFKVYKSRNFKPFSFHPDNGGRRIADSSTVLSCHCFRLGSGSECGGGGSGGGAPAPQSARVSSNVAGGMAVSRVPSPLHDGNTPVAENWCFTQVMESRDFIHN